MLVDPKEIRPIIDMMKKHDLSVFHFEKEGVKIKLKRGVDFEVTPTTVGTPPPPSVPPESVSQETPPVEGTAEITSPMVGTFYCASSPEVDPFVKVGDQVNEETVVCIVEAMKVMNEIKAEKTGVITEILIKDATPVQFGEPLFKIKER